MDFDKLKPIAETAFPLAIVGEDAAGRPTFTTVPGLTKREYFAGQVLTGRLINPASSHQTLQDTAQFAYDLADAMLQAGGSPPVDPLRDELLDIARRMVAFAHAGAGFIYPLGSLDELERAIARAEGQS